MDRSCTLLILEWAIVLMINSYSTCTKLPSPWIVESTLEMFQTSNLPRLCVPLSVEPSQLQQPSSLDSGWKILKSQKAWPFQFKYMLTISQQLGNMSGQSSKQESDSSQWQSPQSMTKETSTLHRPIDKSKIKTLTSQQETQKQWSDTTGTSSSSTLTWDNLPTATITSSTTQDLELQVMSSSWWTLKLSCLEYKQPISAL